jgi:transaldolase / glucose-6-phosphate isomerase
MGANRRAGTIRQDSSNLGRYQAAVDRALEEIREDRMIERVWEHDHTVWKPEPDEVSNRLGWLRSPEEMPGALPEIEALVEAVRADGYTHALLLGMGGSSLAPEVFRRTFGVKEGYLDLAVLDSTDPGAVLAHAESLDLSRTLFIVSTKSGGTVETLSFFKYFYNRVAEAVGEEVSGAHFVAITDPGSELQETAERYGFRATFLSDPNIGGRYSALSHFGLVPAALIGPDVTKLLDGASRMAHNCGGCNSPTGGDNRGAWLGAIMGEMAAASRDKLTLIASPPLAPFGPWVEQLIAESTGKEGTGILPVEGEPVGSPDSYGDDRLFVYMSLRGEEDDRAVEDLVRAGHPVVRIPLDGIYDLGGEMFRWEMATALAGRRLGINPFDQPNVEAAKALARSMVEKYRQEGVLPELEPTVVEDGIAAYSAGTETRVEDAIRGFLAQARPGDYVALQAYVRPTEATTEAMQRLRVGLRDSLWLATTVGYGPRYLHSTGQLHKGDAGNGLFIQLTADDERDAPIPDEAGRDASSLTFGVLKEAQALGDRQALLDKERRFIRFHLGTDVQGGLAKLAGMAL